MKGLALREILAVLSVGLLGIYMAFGGSLGVSQPHNATVQVAVSQPAVAPANLPHFGPGNPPAGNASGPNGPVSQSQSPVHQGGLGGSTTGAGVSSPAGQGNSFASGPAQIGAAIARYALNVFGALFTGNTVSNSPAHATGGAAPGSGGGTGGGGGAAGGSNGGAGGSGGGGGAGGVSGGSGGSTGGAAASSGQASTGASTGTNPPTGTSGTAGTSQSGSGLTSCTAGSSGGAPTGTGGITPLKSYTIPQGNAAHLVWSDDGSSVYLADEEGWMSAAMINATDPTRPTIAATNGQGNYLWAVAQKSGLVVFQSSLGNSTQRYDPKTLQQMWALQTGASHEIATDGSRIFVPVEANPGTLMILNASGAQIASIAAPEGWANVYGIAYDAGTQRLYVSSGGNGSQQSPGGIYIFSVSPSSLLYLGKIAQPSSDIAVQGMRLWRQMGTTIEAWNVGYATSPVLVGSYTASSYDPMTTGGKRVTSHYGNLAVNASGSRLYAAYVSQDAAGTQTLNAPAGFQIFDVSGMVPQPVAQQSWQVIGGYEQPLAVALSPGGATLAVSYWAFGVRFYNVANDAVANLGTVATTGEAHDIYVDGQGLNYVFAHDDIQVIDPTTGVHVQDIPIVGSVVDGGWQPFRDGNIIVPGPSATIMKLGAGAVQYTQPLPGFGNFTWSVVFDGTQYLYQADDSGRIHVDQVSVNPNGGYNVVEVGSVQVPAVKTGSNPILGLALNGQTLWAIGPNTGVVAVDVSAPSVPQVVYHDTFTFATNGSHAGLVFAQGRVYAGAGALGLRIYNPCTFQITGSISGYNVNFLDVAGGGAYLVLANYWYATQPDGVYLYNIAQNPDSPPLTSWFPQPKGNANFRARGSRTNLVYRVPLYGVDILQTP